MRYSVFILFFILLVSCHKNDARRPKSHTTQSFYKEILEQNKKLIQIEERNIQLVLSKDTVHNYQASNNAFWYTYIKKDTLGLESPKINDIVTLQYNVLDVFDNEIYKNKEIEHKIGKENLITGLEDGIKLMKKGEEVIFIIPSYRAYGVTGDGNKIPMNKTLKSRVRLLDVKQNKDNNESN